MSKKKGTTWQDFRHIFFLPWYRQIRDFVVKSPMGFWTVWGIIWMVIALALVVASLLGG